MIPPARPAPEAFHRGLSAVVANPGLILAPFAFVAAALAAVAAPVLVLLLSVAGLPRGFPGMSALARNPTTLLEPLENLVQGMLAAPVVLLGGLLALLVLLLLLTAFAAWIRAGVTGSFLAIDAHAVDTAPLSAFRLPALGSVFRASARRLFGRFFALVNLYGLALSFLVLLLLVPIGLAVLSATSERGGLMVAAFALFLLILPLVIGGAVALRVLYLVAGRLAASEDVDALEAVARAGSWTRASLPRVALLYLLSLGAGFVAGFAFLVPRFALSLVAGRSLALFLTGTGVLVLAQMFVSLSYDLAVTGAFVALWQAKTGSSPPVAYAPAEEIPPRLV
jgi:hypothetical protein